MHGAIRLTTENRVGDFPIAIPMADIHTIGAGGGSIAFVDEGGLLQVGPASAGASPGPACYGLGGTRPTVTDANLVLGRLDPAAFLGGNMTLDVQAARHAVTSLDSALGLDILETAQGIIDIANEHMAQALRAISVERGFDPRQHTLICFGGAGGLHLCELADTLEIGQAIVPIHGGVLSALGMLATKPGRESSRTWRTLLNEPLSNTNGDTGAPEIETAYRELETIAEQELQAEGVFEIIHERTMDLRYQGQTFTLNLPYQPIAQAIAGFHRAHEHRYGHRLARDVELVNLRIHTEATQPGIQLPRWQGNTDPQNQGSVSDAAANTIDVEPGNGSHDLSDINRIDRLSISVGKLITGPVSITETNATTYVAAGWVAESDEYGNLILSRSIPANGAVKRIT